MKEVRADGKYGKQQQGDGLSANEWNNCSTNHANEFCTMNADTPDWLSVTKTAPMELSELADWFNISTRRVKEFVCTIDGAVEVGRRWRIPVREMPPSYLLDAGLIVPQSGSDKLGQRLHGKDLPDTTGRYLNTFLT